MVSKKTNFFVTVKRGKVDRFSMINESALAFRDLDRSGRHLDQLFIWIHSNEKQMSRL